MTAQVFHALGDPTRLLLVERLSTSGSQSMGALTQGLAMSRQAAAKHLYVLKEAGLVVVEGRGRQVMCHLDTERLRQAEAWIGERAIEWDGRLSALKRLVEDTE